MGKNIRFLLYLLIPLVSGCSFIFMKSYGIKSQVKELSNQELIEKAEKLDIAEYPHFRVEESLNDLLDSLFELDSNYFQTLKSLYQPIQLITFDKNGDFLGIIANCDAGGFPNLKWEHLLDTFPSKSYYFNEQTPLSKSMLFRHYEKINEVEVGSGDLLIVGYSHFMGRQNRRFIKKVLEYHSRYASGSILVFANYDLKAFYEEE